MVQLAPTTVGEMGKRILGNISKYMVDKVNHIPMMMMRMKIQCQHHFLMDHLHCYRMNLIQIQR